MSDITIIETRDVVRDYGMDGREAIIDHPRHGRLYITDGYGGEDSLSGGAVRWRHGYVCQLAVGDTFSSLDARHNEYVTVLERVREGHDSARPVREWPGAMVDKLARAAGL